MFRDGLRIWLLAPIIPALIVLPEFAQHVAEIQIGMFDSRDAGRALANDPTRWAFGYAKLTGLLLAILATVRFWRAAKNGGHWWDLRPIAWRNLLIAVVWIALTGLPDLLLESGIGEQITGLINIALGLATLPLLVLLVHGLSGNRDASLRSVFHHDWLAAVRVVAFTATVWIPLPNLHGKNHDWASGAPDALVWILMIFDSIVVGFLATLAGTAIHHGALPLRTQHTASPEVSPTAG
ncbi:MAG: hypothetical protein CMN69_01555 [Sphingomonadaceae bacterium]|nr:hypothetical protein [Sphingomonadaceae bacterium]